jgi:2-polyprenyl-3-methyl-5-hydroxy-6-metoxy-1,4-benzoquinol methylase
MSQTLKHPVGGVETAECGDGLREIRVRTASGENVYRTRYSPELIEKVLAVKGPANVIDEIRREEAPEYVQVCLENDLLGYVREERFAGRRILDFGCGGGASTVILSRMFPSARLVGVELSANLVELAQMRAAFYGLKNVEFYVSPGAEELPADLGTFDFVILSAVFEHLLAAERKTIPAALWRLLEEGGVLFLDQTPNRRFVFEGHTTRLPLVNYLPDGAALWAARRFSRRVGKEESWASLLRRGIRGGTVGEIRGLLRDAQAGYEAVLLEPRERGFRDRIDLWYAGQARSLGRQHPKLRPLLPVVRWTARCIRRLTGAVFVPTLALAFEKRKL